MWSDLVTQLPTMAMEDWKYTSLRPLKDVNFEFDVPLADTFEAFELLKSDGINVVFLNGKLQESLSHLSTTHAALSWMREKINQKQDSDFFANLNTQHAGETLKLTIEKNQIIRKPIYFTYAATALEVAATAFSRVEIHVEEGADVEIVEQFVSLDEKTKHLAVPMVNIKVEKHAKLRFHSLQNVNLQSFVVQRLSAEIAEDGLMEHSVSSIGARLSRYDLNFKLLGEHANLKTYGLYLAKDNQHVDFHTCIDHQSSLSKSTQKYKGILNDKARGVFNGKVVIREGIKEVEAQQSNKNIILAQTAEIDTKPELQIDSGDVKCSHGATVGSLNPLELFYLQSRGIDADEAKKILCEGFAQDILNMASNDYFKTTAAEMIHDFF